MPQLGHSVHVEVEGLQPHRWYFYRFHAGNETSPVGRTRTAPTFHALPDRMRLHSHHVSTTKGDKKLYSMDQWPGYEVSRRRLLQFFHDRKIPNPVVLTGDINLNWVNDLQLNFEDPSSPLVGTELVGTAMTSGGNGGNVILEYERAAMQNDFVRWYNSNRGYVTCDLTPQAWTTHFRTTPFVDKPDSPIETKASFVIESGKPGAKQA